MSINKQSNQTYKLYVGGGITKLTLLVSPAIETHSIAAGWSEDKIESLKNAVQMLVKSNPILTGTLKSKNGELHLTDSQYSPETHSFVTEIAPPKTLPSPKGFGPTEYMKYVQKYIDPLIPKSSIVLDELKKQSPLFAAYLMRLPDDHLYYCFRLSHAVGDGTTYYYLAEQLNSLMRSNKIENTINWDNELKKNWKMYQEPSLFQIICIVICSVLFLFFRRGNQAQCILLDRQKIKEQKKLLCSYTNKCKYLSSNDVICAAMLRGVNDGRVKLAQQISSERGRTKGVHAYDGGNFCTFTEFEASKGCDPNYIRAEITNRQPGAPPDLLPGFRNNMNRLLGKKCLFTNWDSMTRVLDGTVCHFPPPNFLSGGPNNVFVIFGCNDRYIGVLHKGGKLQHNELLAQLQVQPNVGKDQ